MKKVTVEYGGFSAEQEVEENLYNAIYQQGRADAIKQCKAISTNTMFLLDDNSYCWQHCTETDMCGECRRLSNGDLDWFDDTFNE